MRNKLICLVATILLILITGFTYPGSNQNIERKKAYEKQPLFRTMTVTKTDLSKIKDRQLIIKVRNADEVNKLDLESLGLQHIKTPTNIIKRGIILTRIPEGVDFDSKLLKLQAHPLFQSVEPNYLVEATVIPNDPSFNEQWYLSHINMPSAWDLYQGNSDIIVAVLDTGVNYNHPDLRDKMWINSAETENGDDDDFNGYVDDIYGYCTSVPKDSMHPFDPMDDNGHGTMVAGIIAASANNAAGIAGIDWNCKILPVKVLDASGNGCTSSVMEGIYFAINQGADIINMSFGANNDSVGLSNAIWDAYQAGVTLIAASGNKENENTDIVYPAKYIPVISAGATGRTDQRSSFSNYGEGLDITAPGEQILSTKLNNNYSSGSGTSFSAPIVTGILSLLQGKNQAITPQVAEWLLESSVFMPSTCEDSEWNYYYGYGRVDAAAALMQSLPDLSHDVGNDKNSASPLTINQTYSQQHELPLDDDWFRFEVDRTAEVTIDIAVPPTLDIVAWLEQDENGTTTWEKVIDNSGCGGNESQTFTLNPGVYYLHIYDYNGHWSEEPYHLKVSYPIPPTSLSLNQRNLTLTAGGKAHNLLATITPVNVSDPTVVWTSNQPQIASVIDGIVNPVGSGDTIITANTWDGSQNDYCAVNVLTNDTEPLQIQKVETDNSNQTILLIFSDNLLNNTADENELKTAISLAVDGTTFETLDPADTTTIEGSTLVINLKTPLGGNQNLIKIAPEALTNESRTSLNAEITAPVSITDACFIATAAYGSFLDPHVSALRKFRDKVLLQSYVGRWFVDQYYLYSPPLAHIIAQNAGLKFTTRILLTPFVFTVQYPAPVAACIIILILILAIRYNKSVLLMK
jgi:subtilisin family serine protease